MKCMYCGCLDSKVIDSRLNDEGTSIRRRRECTNCGKRYTTYETIELTPVMVVKRNGCRQTFSIQKVKQGIVKACEKRPVSMQQIDELAADIEKRVANHLVQEIKSSEIGEMIMDGLKKIDDVAYVRFAAVHRQFKDINSWLSEINDLVSKREGENR